MPTEITMPKLSDTMEQGSILRWYKHEGEHVEAGEVLAEVETDKADMEVEASASGTLAEIRVREGASVAVGAVIAVLDGTAETAQRAQRPVAPSPPPRRAVQPPAPATPPASPSATRQSRGHVTAAPHGTQPLSKLRQAVAKQMTASKREVPHFYVIAEIDMTEAARLRASLSAGGVIPERVTFTHLMIRALALILPRHPRVNASWSEGNIVYHDSFNIGVAVAVEDGLVAPVLRDCQRLSLRAIAQAMNALVEKAHAGHFGGDALTGATFTLSNMGMLDIDEFSAVITPPQAAVLAVGAIKDRPVARDGQMTVAKTVRVTLSVDHRVLNGVEAARFVEDFKRALENPLALLLGPE
jgi:pyruvate dehydrogenase E2 component (dihydrolipoamide acetyltransferase)